MWKPQAPKRHRNGLSLLELMTAVTMASTLMLSTAVLLRSSYAVWQAHDADHEAGENAHAVLRHLVRTIRQSSEVTSITGPTDDAGELGLNLASGVQVAYTADAPGEVWYWTYPGPVASALAPDVDSLRFTGYEADGVTTTTVAADVQVVKARATITMPTGGQRTVSCSAWIRSW